MMKIDIKSVSAIIQAARIIHSAFLPNLHRTYDPIIKPNTTHIIIRNTFMISPHQHSKI